MFKLDNNFLISLGLGGLPVEEKNKLLQVIYERLEMNVGMRLAEKMTDQQLDEFESFIDRSDEAGALKWLETNFPNYKDVVAEELDKLRNEVSASAPQILAASGLQNSMPAQGQAAPQPQAPNQPPMAAPENFQPLQQPAPQPQDPAQAAPPQPVQPQYGQPQYPAAPQFQPAQQPYSQPQYPPMQQGGSQQPQPPQFNPPVPPMQPPAGPGNQFPPNNPA